MNTNEVKIEANQEYIQSILKLSDIILVNLPIDSDDEITRCIKSSSALKNNGIAIIGINPFLCSDEKLDLIKEEMEHINFLRNNN